MARYGSTLYAACTAATRPRSLRAKSTSMTCSAASLGSASKAILSFGFASSTRASTPRGNVPAIGRSDAVVAMQASPVLPATIRQLADRQNRNRTCTATGSADAAPGTLQTAVHRFYRGTALTERFGRCPRRRCIPCKLQHAPKIRPHSCLPSQDQRSPVLVTAELHLATGQ